MTAFAQKKVAILEKQTQGEGVDEGQGGGKSGSPQRKVWSVSKSVGTRTATENGEHGRKQWIGPETPADLLFREIRPRGKKSGSGRRENMRYKEPGNYVSARARRKGKPSQKVTTLCDPRDGTEALAAPAPRGHKSGPSRPKNHRRGGGVGS